MPLGGRREVLAMRRNIGAACRVNGIQTLLSPVSYKLKKERNPK
jgi:hypothetical protein